MKLDNITSLNNKKMFEQLLKNSQQNFTFYDSFDAEYIDFLDESLIYKIKNEYDLEKLIVENELETIRNATNFVSNVLKSNLPPKYVKGTCIDIINTVRSGCCGANCRTHAIVLSQILTAMGFLSRYVFCYPIDYMYSENHVVTIVYSKQYHKWFLFDAAQNLYYTDTSGKILDIFELRTKLANSEKVKVELLDEYWGNYTDKEKLLISTKNLIYMSKNVYRFACFQSSMTDHLAQNRIVKLYHLVPLNYIQTPFSVSSYDKYNKVKYEELFISNCTDFFNRGDVL